MCPGGATEGAAMPPRKPNTQLGMKAGDGPGLIVVDVENGVQPGDLQKVADFLVQVQKFQFPALAFHLPVAGHQFPQARAVDVIDPGQIHDYFFVARAESFADKVAQQVAAFSESDAPLHVDHRNFADFAAHRFETHRQPFLHMIGNMRTDIAPGSLDGL